jgi:hypothetical protein
VSLPQDASNSTVFGIAAPFSVRVWSTMNAPLLFSTVLSAGLILMVELKGWKAVLAAMAGYAAFILSFVRTAWIGWLVGMLILLFSGRSKSARRILLVLALLPCCIAVLSLNSEIRDAIETRIGTLAGVGGDESVQAREDLYRASISKVLEEPFGMGPGSESGRLDSGIFSTIAMLGPTGALLYGAGTLILAFGMFKSPSATPFSTATKAIYLSTLFQALSANLIVNSPGAVMWTAAGLWLASSETVPYAIAKHSAMPLLQTKQLPA